MADNGVYHGLSDLLPRPAVRTLNPGIGDARQDTDLPDMATGFVRLRDGQDRRSGRCARFRKFEQQHEETEAAL